MVYFYSLYFWSEDLSKLSTKDRKNNDSDFSKRASRDGCEFACGNPQAAGAFGDVSPGLLPGLG